MQSVPSLIGAGTAVAAAATGLVFGQLAEGQPEDTPQNSPYSSKHKSISDHDHSSAVHSTLENAAPVAVTIATAARLGDDLLSSAKPSMHANAPSAQSRLTRRASSHAQITPTKPSSARQSLNKNREFPGVPVVEDPRDSLSSNGSWMRRLSIRPLSQHGSLRSSLGPDSPSIFSFGSNAPILPSPRDAPSQLPPNKLVKRAPGTSGGDAGFPTRRGSRAQMTLRRPATSHQRSATLQHQIDSESLPPLPNFSIETQKRPRAKTVGNRFQQQATPHQKTEEPSRWRSFWHSRLSLGVMKGSALRGGENNTHSMGKRIGLGQEAPEQVYLVAPAAIMKTNPEETAVGPPRESEHLTTTDNSPQSSEKSQVELERTPSKQPKRSISMQFSSPTNWITKTKPGSLRRRKRGGDTLAGKRNVSAPVSGDTQQVESNTKTQDGYTSNGTEVSQAEVDLAAIFRPPETKQSPPSPLPPLSRLSSFHMELNRLGSSSSVSQDRPEEPSLNQTITSRVNSQTSNTRTLERASTVGSSDYYRGFTSGDDDDTDFKTDTPFDSFRTVASGRKRTLDSPLESMFDDSPPSTAANHTKPKRLSIQEILGPSFDVGNKITEEDENIPTPIRGTYEEFEARFRAASIEDDDVSIQQSLLPDLPVERDYSRLSLDDDDDLSWAREDEMEVYHHLSPPSSMNSRRGSPNFRSALRGISGNANSDVRFDSVSERPRSTVFDWSEPPVHDKRERNGYGYRPKTVHGKQESDMRGGRSSSRRSLIPNHVRSQSVPIVPDPTEATKSAPKFGTWGLGQKNVSEDWDDDFDFDEDKGSTTGPAEKEDRRFSMFVPANIQATQPTVRAHSGQIRELSLLVNDLKRLCRLGREMDMVSGPTAKLWHEAEGIIALASPDEDTSEIEDAQTLDEFDLDIIDDQYIEQGFDGDSLDGTETPAHTEQSIQLNRRRSVFSPGDDIFGSWDQRDGASAVDRPMTPENPIPEPRSTSVARSVMESMRVRRTTMGDVEEPSDTAERASNRRFNFDTNSLKELVKRAGDLRDSLSEVVRRVDRITNSPIRTPKHTRADGSPAFTRVFDEPTSSPTRRVALSHSNTSGLSSTTVNASSPSNGINRRMHMMTVS
ncbi:hypothetical protein GGR57DRAFT_89424 [Xylariaceae sp. FL1272]|nr:hypothetical protein GGR57DRAFT_89424 [Xylariaceae sp. FL1272]